jgi:hypothetical protein
VWAGLALVWWSVTDRLWGAEFEVVPGRRQLFFDDVGVAGREGLVRVFHRPEKRGAVVRSPRSDQAMQTRTAPIWDEARQKWLLYVLTTTENLWESADGLNWQPLPNPNLRIDMAVRDTRETNPARRFKAPLLNRGFAVSSDGLQWTPIETPAIASSDEGNFTLSPTTGLFIHTVKRGGPNGRAVAIATSTDFTTWTDLGVVFAADDLDQEQGRRNIEVRLADNTLLPPRYHAPEDYRVDVYNMGVFEYEGQYLGLPAMFHSTGKVPNYPNTDGFHLVQVVHSRDLKTWNRVGDRQTFLGPSRVGSGAYDLTQIISPSAPVVRGDELWFYYTGLKWRSSFDYEGTYPNGKTILLPERNRDGGAVCLAILRRDGFVSVDAGETPGLLTTAPFTLAAGGLRVNLQAPRGDLQVELWSAGNELLARSAPLVGDLPQGEVMWELGELAAHVGKRVSLRFRLTNGALYSWWIQPPG